MEVQDIIQKVKKIEIQSKLLSTQQFAGAYHTAFKGRGMQFSEVREYAYGDDIRHIDWNVSARMQSPHVKIFQEEREQTIFFLIDLSPSVLTSIAETSRLELIAELVATLAFAANRAQDKIGLLLFDKEVRHYIPPNQGYQHIFQIIRSIIRAEPVACKNIQFNDIAFQFKKRYKGHAVVFLISDFLLDDYRNGLKLLSIQNDLIGIKIKDPLDGQLPDLGLLQILDVETNQLEWIDTSSKAYRAWYQEQKENRERYFDKSFAEVRASTIILEDGDDYTQSLRRFFHQRAQKR